MVRVYDQERYIYIQTYTSPIQLSLATVPCHKDALYYGYDLSQIFGY